MTQIIYLNGPTSVGKTTLAKFLRESIDEPFLHVGIDRFIGMMPEKFNDWTGKSATLGFYWRKICEKDHTAFMLESGPVAKNLISLYRQTVVFMAEQNANLIIDDIAFGQSDVNRWRILLAKFNVLWIGLHAPLHILEQREQERNNRILGSARDQWRKTHEGIDYDLFIDTSIVSVEESAKMILRKMKK